MSEGVADAGVDGAEGEADFVLGDAEGGHEDDGVVGDGAGEETVGTHGNAGFLAGSFVLEVGGAVRVSDIDAGDHAGAAGGGDVWVAAHEVIGEFADEANFGRQLF